jgi:hypothetical protein
MTAAEFEAGYAARSGITVAQLHALGLYAERCDCGDETCEGWAMRHVFEHVPRVHGYMGEWPAPAEQERTR